MTQYLDPHLEHRRAQERKHFETADDDVMSSLVDIELNITELCNRTCSFCPRADANVYPNRNLHMDMDIVSRITAQIAAERLSARISLSGFGEPMLHPAIFTLICWLDDDLPDNVIEMNTNGDQLTKRKVGALFGAGLTYLYINMYDGPEQAPKFRAMMEGFDPASWRLRPHWNSDDFGLTLNNRSGNIIDSEIGLAPLTEPLKRRCHYPFYKMLIDWNGDVLFCSNDWGREIIIGNIMETGIRELWLSEKMFEIRRRLADGDRSHNPCNKCNVDGLLHGEQSFNRLMEHMKGGSRSD